MTGIHRTLTHSYLVQKKGSRSKKFQKVPCAETSQEPIRRAEYITTIF